MSFDISSVFRSETIVASHVFPWSGLIHGGACGECTKRQKGWSERTQVRFCLLPSLVSIWTHGRQVDSTDLHSTRLGYLCIQISYTLCERRNFLNQNPVWMTRLETLTPAPSWHSGRVKREPLSDEVKGNETRGYTSVGDETREELCRLRLIIRVHRHNSSGS